MAYSRAPARLGRKQWLFLLLAVAAFYVLLPQLGIFRTSFASLRHMRLSDLAAASGLTGLTYLAAAFTYCLLAKRPLAYGRTVLMQLASMFANRLLPAGIGGIGTNYAYLRANKHSAVQAASVVAANNLLGFAGHILLVGLVLAWRHQGLAGLHRPQLSTPIVLAGIVLLVVGAIGLAAASNWRRRVKIGLSGVLGQLVSYRHQKARLLAALLSSMALTLCNVSSLYACVLALQLHLSFVAVLLVFSLAVGLGTVTPVPGGLGGFEAGLVAGLVAYHATGAEALAVVLAYRLLSYWLPLIVGGAAFVIAERRGYFSH